MRILIFKNSEDTTITVRLVKPGDSFGYNGCLVYTGNNSLVEFFDSTFIDRNYEHGRFITRLTWTRFKSVVTPWLPAEKENWKLSETDKANIINWCNSIH
jgi:hypothetical protein